MDFSKSKKISESTGDGLLTRFIRDFDLVNFIIFFAISFDCIESLLPIIKISKFSNVSFSIHFFMAETASDLKSKFL